MKQAKHNRSDSRHSSPDSPVKATPVISGKESLKFKDRFRFTRSNRIINWFILLSISFATFLAISIVVVISAGMVYYLSIQNSSRILQGVSSSGFQLGNHTTTEAAILLHKSWNLENKVILSSGDKSYTVQPKDIGLFLDPMTTAENAYQMGRRGSFFQRVQTIFDTSLIGQEIEPVIVVDIQEARSKLVALEPIFSTPAVEPELIYENGSLSSTQGKTGNTINIDQTLKILEDKSSSILFSGALPVILTTVSPKKMDLSSLVDEAQNYLDNSLVLQFFDPITNEWTERIIPPEEIASWLSSTSTDEEPQLIISQNDIEDYLLRLNESFSPDRYFDREGLAESIIVAMKGKPTETILIKHHPTTYIVKPGDTLLRIGWNLGIPYWRIADQNPDINPNELITGQAISIPSRDDLIPLPIIEHKRIVISISKQRLWAYENDEQVAKEVISTGIDRSPTQPGVFQVQTHIKSAYASVWDLTMPNFLGIYEAWPGFMNGIHGLPTLSNGQRLWANILGRPASYGCIILNLDAAKWLYNWAEDGVIVEITP